MQKLKTVDADTLLSTPLPANQFVEERLLPQGLHILAGASKVGKSWLALWLCLCVAKGEPVWGLTTVRGTVLYLCLEDSLSRIQGRLFQLTENAPAALHFATMAGNIGKGLEEQIEGFLQMYRDTVLVVIDTLQKVRISNSAANPYANDYQDLSSLKALADRYRVAILAIHHIRKMQDDDPFNRISGTTGISGGGGHQPRPPETGKKQCGSDTPLCWSGCGVPGTAPEVSELPLAADRAAGGSETGARFTGSPPFGGISQGP